MVDTVRPINVCHERVQCKAYVQLSRPAGTRVFWEWRYFHDLLKLKEVPCRWLRMRAESMAQDPVCMKWLAEGCLRMGSLAQQSDATSALEHTMATCVLFHLLQAVQTYRGSKPHAKLCCKRMTECLQDMALAAPRSGQVFAVDFPREGGSQQVLLTLGRDGRIHGWDMMQLTVPQIGHFADATVLAVLEHVAPMTSGAPRLGMVGPPCCGNVGAGRFDQGGGQCRVGSRNCPLAVWGREGPPGGRCNWPLLAEVNRSTQ